MVERIDIRPEMLSWAIERTGQDVNVFLARHEDVCDWMSGKKKPTAKQLEVFAGKMHLPFGYLFLPTPPQEEIPFPLFRGSAGQGSFSHNVYDTVMDVCKRQQWLEEYLPANEIPLPSFIGSVSPMNGVDHAVSELRRILHLEPCWTFDLRTSEQAVIKLTAMIEDAGVFVAFNGVVGNNTHRPIDVEECRGFALTSEIAPFIYINSQDAKTAQLFTLMHEMAHLLIGVSAGHAGDYELSLDGTERFCDAVAAEFLVPREALINEWSDISSCAKKFKVSQLVVARRAHDIGLLSNSAYQDFYQRYRSRPIPAKKTSVGGDFYATSKKRVGRLFAIHVNNAVNSRQLSLTEAYRMTGVYGNTFNHLMTLV